MHLQLRTMGLAALLATALASCGAAASQSAPRGADSRLLDVLGTLRRPQTRADLADAGLRRQLRVMSRHRWIAGRPVRRLVRLATVAQIEAGADWGTNRSDQLLIVVPDGVAKVTVRPVRTSGNAHPAPVTATVHGNVAAFESDQNLDDPQAETWYGPSGEVLRRIGRP